MTPLGRVTAGLFVVLADIRVAGVDVLADVLGWALVVAGLAALSRRDGRFVVVRRLSVLAGVLSLADLVHPVVTVTESSGSVTTSSTGPADPVGFQGAAAAAGLGVAVVVLVLLSRRLSLRAWDHGDGAVARRFGRFAVLHAVLGGVAVAGVVWALLAGTEGAEPLGGGVGWVLLALVLSGLAVQVWFLVALAGVRELPWLREPDPAVA